MSLCGNGQAKKKIEGMLSIKVLQLKPFIKTDADSDYSTWPTTSEAVGSRFPRARRMHQTHGVFVSVEGRSVVGALEDGRKAPTIPAADCLAKSVLYLIRGLGAAGGNGRDDCRRAWQPFGTKSQRNQQTPPGSSDTPA
jgi:hypothetical protein